MLLHLGAERVTFLWSGQERIKEVAPRAIVLSGGPNSVHIADAPQLSPGFFEYCAAHGIPVLGICYGMQLLVHVRAPSAVVM